MYSGLTQTDHRSGELCDNVFSIYTSRPHISGETCNNGCRARSPMFAKPCENVVGPVYKIKCEECNAVYVGETERSLKARFGEHRRPSSTTLEVSKHIHVDHPQHSVELENTEVLTTEPRWFERGVKEAIYIRALNPSLNRDGGRYNLPPVWDNIIKKRVKADRPRRRG